MRGLAGYRFVASYGPTTNGSAWLAVPPAGTGLDGAQVVVKVLDRFADDATFRRMANELRLLDLARSPHLVRVLDAGHVAGRLYYVMPHYQAGTCAHSDLSPRRRVAALAGAARGAHALHQVGVVHRNIKPSSVYLEAGSGVLGNLGLAQLVDPGPGVQPGVGPIGSLEVMEPQLARGSAAAPASDVWSIGACLHLVLTGMSVYPGLDGLDLAGAVSRLAEDAPTIDPAVPTAARPLVEACLAPARNHRPDSALEVAEALEALPPEL